MSQTDLILDHLQAGKPITPLQALRLWGCFRLAARIADLRERGYEIASERVETQHGKRVAMYRLMRKGWR